MQTIVRAIKVEVMGLHLMRRVGGDLAATSQELLILQCLWEGSIGVRQPIVHGEGWTHLWRLGDGVKTSAIRLSGTYLVQVVDTASGAPADHEAAPAEAEIQAALDYGRTAEQHLRYGAGRN